MRCFSNLEVEKNSGIQDPKKGRDSRKTPEQRKNPILKRKEEKLAKAGIVRYTLDKNTVAIFQSWEATTGVLRVTRKHPFIII